MLHCFPVGDLKSKGYSNQRDCSRKIYEVKKIILKSCYFKLLFSGLVVVEKDRRKTKNHMENFARVYISTCPTSC